MQTCIHDYSEEQLANGYKFFLKHKEKSKRLSNTKASKNQDKISHTDFQAKTGQGDRKNLHQSRLPSGVANSVVQDYTPNNHRSGVTNILNQLAEN